MCIHESIYVWVVGVRTFESKTEQEREMENEMNPRTNDTHTHTHAGTKHTCVEKQQIGRVYVSRIWVSSNTRG